MLQLSLRFCLIGMLSLVAVACQPSDPEGASTSPDAAETGTTGTYEVTIVVQLPENAPENIYIAGNLPSLGPWHPSALKTTGSGQERRVTFAAPHGHPLEFKVTAGSWEQEGLGPSGTLLPNFRLLVDEDKTFTASIAGFRRDPKALISDWQGSGVEGTLVYWNDVASKHLSATRHVVVWLPPDYEDSDQRSKSVRSSSFLYQCRLGHRRSDDARRGGQ